MSIEQEPWHRYRYEPVQHEESIPLAVWQVGPMRVALAHRDVQAVFKLLQKYGVSQRRIAHFTRQTQSEISDIILGKRTVSSYDLLLRIAEGLGIPRGWMGLALEPPDEEAASG